MTNYGVQALFDATSDRNDCGRASRAQGAGTAVQRTMIP